MLIDDSRIYNIDPISAAIAKMNNNKIIPIKLHTGIYQIGNFNLPINMDLDYNSFMEFNDEFKNYDSFGVCDNWEQVIEKYNWIKTHPREFIITITPVLKKNQPEDGGWRWHKWGEYIGDKVPTCEYLYDEPFIDQVFIFHIYLKKEI